MIRTFEAKDGQSIFDLCIQSGYPIENIYDLIQLNQFANINQQSFAGVEVNFNTDLVKDFSFVNNLFSNNISLSTGDPQEVYADSSSNFILRQDGGRLLRQDGGKFLRNG